MVGDLAVTFETREPSAAAFEFDRDDIEIAVIVGTSSLGVDINAADDKAMLNKLHFLRTRLFLAQFSFHGGGFATL